MSGFARFLRSSSLMLGLALLCVPASLQAQTAEERAREQELRQRLEARAQAMEEYRQVMEHRLQSIQEEQHLRIEEALARAGRLHFSEEEALARQFEAQAEHLARAEEAQQRYMEAAAGYREQAEEARARAEERLREAQQVVIQMKSRVRLGVSLDATQGEELDRQGARIQSVIENSPAQEAGLQEGDIITHLNGRSLLDPIPNEEEKELDAEESLPVQRLIALAQELEAGDEVEVRYLRDGQAQSASFEAADVDDPSIAIFRRDLGNLGRVLRVQPGERGVWTLRLPEGEEAWLEIPKLKEMENLRELELQLKELELSEPNLRLRYLPEGGVRGFAFGGGDAPFMYNFIGTTAGYGLSLTKMNPGLAEYFSSETGLLVLDVDEDSMLGLLPGDVILAIDGRAVEDQADVRRILGSYDDEEAVSFTVVRKGQEIQVEGKVR